MEAPARTIAVATRTTDTLLIGGAGIITGWSWVEPTNAAGAAFDLYDGQNATGTLLASITLLQNESTRDLIAGAGLEFRQGLYLDILSGSVKGAVWIVTAESVTEDNVLTVERDSWDRAHA